MTTVASLELCKQLYELSGWYTDEHWWRHDGSLDQSVTYEKNNEHFPAYDADFLLERLRVLHAANYQSGEQSLFVFTLEIGLTGASWLINCDQGVHGMFDRGRSIRFRHFQVTGKRAADALCELAIKLFYLGVLKRGTE